jgi:hypothetical protein
MGQVGRIGVPMQAQRGAVQVETVVVAQPIVVQHGPGRGLNTHVGGQLVDAIIGAVVAAEGQFAAGCPGHRPRQAGGQEQPQAGGCNGPRASGGHEADGAHQQAGGQQCGQRHEPQQVAVPDLKAHQPVEQQVGRQEAGQQAVDRGPARSRLAAGPDPGGERQSQQRRAQQCCQAGAPEAQQQLQPGHGPRAEGLGLGRTQAAVGDQALGQKAGPLHAGKVPAGDPQGHGGQAQGEA